MRKNHTEMILIGNFCLYANRNNRRHWNGMLAEKWGGRAVLPSPQWASCSSLPGLAGALFCPWFVWKTLLDSLKQRSSQGCCGTETEFAGKMKPSPQCFQSRTFLLEMEFFWSLWMALSPCSHTTTAAQPWFCCWWGVSCCGVSPELSGDFLALQSLQCSSDFVLCCAHGFIQQHCWGVRAMLWGGLSHQEDKPWWTWGALPAGHSPRRMDTNSTMAWCTRHHLGSVWAPLSRHRRVKYWPHRVCSGLAAPWAGQEPPQPSPAKGRAESTPRSLGSMQGAASVCCQTLLSFDKDKSVAYLTQPLWNSQLWVSKITGAE